MLSGLWRSVRVHAETLRQYRSALVTAEALVWHHGYNGLNAALKAAETPTGNLREDVRAELVAQSQRIGIFSSRTPTSSSARDFLSTGVGEGGR